jgi:hypothetical protein
VIRTVLVVLELLMLLIVEFSQQVSCVKSLAVESLLVQE